jgi:hypothetical protein
LHYFAELFPSPATALKGKPTGEKKGVRQIARFEIEDTPREKLFFLARLILENIIDAGGREIWDGLQMDTAVQRIYEYRQYPYQDAAEELQMLKVLTRHLRRFCAEKITDTPDLLLRSLAEDDCGQFIRLHEFEGVQYYRKESLERFLRWLAAVRYLDALRTLPATRWAAVRRKEIAFLHATIALSDASGYRFTLFKSSITKTKKPARRPSRSR